MKKRLLLIFVLLVASILLTSLILARPPVKTCPITQDTDIVFYGETGFGGVGTLSRSWVIHFLDWWQQQDSSIEYVELDDNSVTDLCDLDSFSNLKIYIQPGGDAYKMQNKLGPEGRQNILDYIDSGKGYLGICAGWYYTANDYYWQGDYYNHPDMLDYYPTTVEGSITDIADYEGNPDHALTPLSTGFNAIYYGGPTVGWRDTSLPAPGVTEATFTAISGDLPAIVKYNGNALLTSVHLEAFENDGVDGLTTEDRIENYKYLANLLNEVSGTNYYVPAYADPAQCGDGIDNDGDGEIDYPEDDGCDSINDDDETDPLPPQCNDGVDNDGDSLIDYPNDPGCSSADDDNEVDPVVTQCNDGVDNDGDTLVDMQDPGCESEEDDDEYNVPGPIELFNDGFESGLGAWSLYGSGSSWKASTDTSYEGSYSARAKKTGVSKDSFMETSIDASGYSSVTFEYYRRLVGLDAADDFEVQYLDGSWISVEHLGDGRANDNSFVYKSFSIPSTATAIRFKCECGAVSEKCYVDNVKVIAE